MEYSLTRSRTATPDFSVLAEIYRGNHGVALEIQLNGVRVCAKAYFHRECFSYAQPAIDEFLRCSRAQLELPQIATHIQNPIGYLELDELGCVFLSELVRDFDGRVSANLTQAPTVSKRFVDELSHVFEAIVESSKLLNPTPTNILVKRINPETEIPVLVDFANYEKPFHYPLKAALLKFNPKWRRDQVTRWAANTLKFLRPKIR